VPLILQFLGLPQIHLDNQPIVTDRRKAIALLAYVTVNDLGNPPQKYSRAILSALLWPDYEQAKAFSNLRRTILEIRQSIGENWLITSRETVQLNMNAEIDLDITRFHDLLSQAHRQLDIPLRISLLADTVRLYRNHFLTGFSLKNAPDFNEWAFAETEELRRQLADALTLLVDSYCELKQAEYAIPHARRLIALDPLNESAHRQLMEIYVQVDQPNAALKQYLNYEKLLRKELNLDPQPETRALYKKLRKSESRYVSSEKIVDEPKRVIPKHNLPAHLTSFIGREKEREEICNLLARNRLVTVIGVGGIGKSRLALDASENLLTTYPHGVWLVSLDSLINPTLLPQRVASIFGIIEMSEHSITEKLITFLHDKVMVLIIDNCEHLREACAQLIYTLLNNCPELKILATSREVIGVEGEKVYNTPALSVTETTSIGLPKKLPQNEAAQLFYERAQLSQTNFSLTTKNAASVAQICRRLDGIPLAIELAAARLDVLQVDEILKQLNDCFHLLVGNDLTVIPRHQTMRASMDWSWGLLPASEKGFLRQLSVFAGGWTLESAQAICQGDILNLTGALVKKSLIVVIQESGRETRYRFHEIVRQYAQEKLILEGEEENARDLHLKYFLELSEQAESGLRGLLQMEWIAHLNDERDNMRAALAWADKANNVEAGLYLSGTLDFFWFNSDLQEGFRWLTTFLMKSESYHYPRARAKALCVQAQIFNVLEQFSEGRSAAEECLALYRLCADPQGEIDGLLTLGGIPSNIPQDQKAKLNQEALALAQVLHNKWKQAIAYWHLGWDHHDFQAAFGYWEKAIALFRQLGDKRFLATCLSAFGYFQLMEGNIDSAQKYLDESEALFHQLNINPTRTSLLEARSQIALMRGDYEQARAYLQESLTISNELGSYMESVWNQVRLGNVALREGSLIEAHNTLTKTAREFSKNKNEIGFVYTIEVLSSFFVIIGKPDYAARLIGWANGARKKNGNKRPIFEQAEVDKHIAACLVAMGEVAFSDAYDEGEKMVLEEIVEYALRGN